MAMDIPFPSMRCLHQSGSGLSRRILPDADEPHVGSIDVDFALDAANLGEGRYADLLKLLLDTKRYKPGANDFQLVVEVDLNDGDRPVQVEVDFLAPKEVKLKKNRPKLLENFRVLQVEDCGVAFHAPVEKTITGLNIRGAKNKVRLHLASLADFLMLKAYAIDKRDKPKDSYDLCYCLDHVEGGMEQMAVKWKQRAGEKEVARAIGILREKFEDPESFGPQQVIEFHNSPNSEERAMQARRAYELVRKFLNLIDGKQPYF